MSRNCVFAPGEYYHIYARGFEKSATYRSMHDYKRFLESLYLLNTSEAINIKDVKKYVSNKSRGLTSGEEVFLYERQQTLVDIGAYSLMPNHFHLLVREKDADGKGVSKFMQKLMTSYTMYFNKKYNRTGGLFGSTFKAKHVTNDNHLKYMFAYIHLNPDKICKSKKQKLEMYKYSSYGDYLGEERLQANIINKQSFPAYFTPHTIKKEMKTWEEYEI